jgi:hypothetical protein
MMVPFESPARPARGQPGHACLLLGRARAMSACWGPGSTGSAPRQQSPSTGPRRMPGKGPGASAAAAPAPRAETSAGCLGRELRLARAAFVPSRRSCGPLRLRRNRTCPLEPRPEPRTKRSTSTLGPLDIRVTTVIAKQRPGPLQVPKLAAAAADWAGALH